LQVQDAYFEDLEPGQEFRTARRTITEADIAAFAGLSGDYHALHTDAIAASEGPYGRRIAHGLLSLSVASGLVARLGLFERSIVAFRELTCKFRRPVFAGDTVHTVVRVHSTKALSRTGQGVAELDVRMYNQEDGLVHQGKWKVVMRYRDKAS
jgi:3-hydroxybutyryl-CoA dehydratase